MKNIFVLLVLLYMQLMHFSTFSQVSPPDTIAVELISGDAACCFNLPAKFIATSFMGPLTSFTGSNNKLETGSPLYSSQVEAGATVYAINGQIPGFPTRIGSNNPPINRSGGSSFIAIKEDGEGNRKIWINISVGAFMISGGVTYNWEYQFRYFEDTKTGTKQATLGTVPNNGGYFGSNVVCRVGSRFEDSELIQGNIKDVVANVTIGTNTYPPLEGVNVQLVSGPTVYANVLTDKNGYYEIDASNLDKQINYSIRASFGNNEQSQVVVEQANIKVPSVVPDITLPYTLKLDIENTKSKLSNIKFDVSVADVPLAITLPGYNAIGVDNTLSDWSEIDGDLKVTIESMNRMLLELDMLDKYLQGSKELPGKFMNLSFALLWSIKELSSTTTKLYAGLNEKRTQIENQLKLVTDPQIRYELKKMLIFQIAYQESLMKVTKAFYEAINAYLLKPSIAKVPDPNLRDGLTRIANILPLMLEKPDFTKLALGNLIGTLGSQAVVQGFYVDYKTQKLLNTSIEKANNNQYSGNFGDAVAQAHTQYIETSEKNSLAIAKGENLETVSKVYETLSGIITSAAEMLATFPFSKKALASSTYTLSKWLQGLSVSGSGLALYYYSSRYLEITDEITSVTDGAFYPFGAFNSEELLVGPNQNPENADSDLIKLMQQYNDSLFAIREAVKIENYEEVAQLVINTAPIEKALDSQTKAHANHLYATLSKVEESDTDIKEFADQLISLFGVREVKRAVVSSQVFSYLTDEENSEYKEALFAELDTLVALNNNLLANISQYENATSELATGSFIAIQQINFPDSIVHSSDFILEMEFRNYGTEASGPFKIKLVPSTGLSISIDTVEVSGLAGGGVGNLDLQVSAGLITKSPYIVVNFEGVNGFSEPIIFNLSSAIFTKDDVQSQTISFNTISSKTFGDPPFSLSAKASSGLPVSFSIVSGPATVADSTLTITGAGTVIVRASQAGDTTYAAAPDVDRSFNVAKANQSINFENVPNKSVGDPPFQVKATATSGLPVTVGVVSGPATIANNTVTLRGEGLIKLKASQAGNENYKAAADVEKSFCVVPAKPAIEETEMELTSSSLTGNQWYFNGTLIQGATSNAYVPERSGSYTVQVAGACGMSPMSDPVNITVEDIEARIKVFPIPANDVLNVIFPGKMKWTEVRIVDLNGKVWITSKPTNLGNHMKLKVDQLPDGMYVVVIFTKEAKYNKSILIKH